MNLHQKLVEVRKACPYLQKDSQGHQYNFVGSAAVLYALRQAMDAQGVLLVPSVTGVEYEQPKGEKRGMQMTSVTMKFTWVNADEPEQRIECNWYGQGIDNAEKGVGKALTYAEKYFLLKFFNIATDKDDPDRFQATQDRKKPAKADPEFPWGPGCVSKVQWERIGQYAEDERLSADLRGYCAKARAMQPSQLPAKKAGGLIGACKAELAEVAS